MSFYMFRVPLDGGVVFEAPGGGYQVVVFVLWIRAVFFIKDAEGVCVVTRYRDAAVLDVVVFTDGFDQEDDGV
jgi:hypothetical protein